MNNYIYNSPFQVSSPTRQNTAGLKLLSSARADFNLPSTTPFIHFETTDYFTPDGRDYPMPHNNVFVQVKFICQKLYRRAFIVSFR